MPSARKCSVCNKVETSEKPIQRCARCQDRLYCGKQCQKADWEAHKGSCRAKIGLAWYDRYRKCKDGSRHEGKLELITWPSPREGLGWGACFAEESDDLKRKFEEEYGGDEANFYKYWPQGFRWTCCGTDAGMKWGCDHHGTGSKPCTCDFCRMGKQLPDSIYKKQSAPRHGLNLSRGPDPRSFHPSLAQAAAAGRSVMGLEL